MHRSASGATAPASPDACLTVRLPDAACQSRLAACAPGAGDGADAGVHQQVAHLHGVLPAAAADGRAVLLLVRSHNCNPAPTKPLLHI